MAAFEACWDGLSAHMQVLLAQPAQLLMAAPHDQALMPSAYSRMPLATISSMTLAMVTSKITQVVLDEANAGTFRELAAFVRAQHASPSKRARAADGPSGSTGNTARRQRLIPAALTVAGGVNSTDHARTFPDLVALLRAQAPHLPLSMPLHACFLASSCTTRHCRGRLMRQHSSRSSAIPALLKWLVTSGVQNDFGLRCTSDECAGRVCIPSAWFMGSCCAQGCHAALLQPRELGAGAGVGDALNAVLRQFSGLDTDASDMEVRHSAMFSSSAGDHTLHLTAPCAHIGICTSTFWADSMVLPYLDATQPEKSDIKPKLEPHVGSMEGFLTRCR